MRGRRPPGALLAFALGLLVVAAAALVVGSSSDLRLTGYNDAPVQIDVATVPAGARACQPNEPLWEGTKAVHLTGRVEGAPALLRAERGAPDGEAVAGRWVAVEPGTKPILPLGRPGRDGARDELCVANRGPGTLVLAGVKVGAEARVAVADAERERLGAGRMRVEGLAAEVPTSAWSTAGRIPERIASATGVGIAPWLVGAGLLVALLGAAALLARRGPARTPAEVALVVVLTLAIGTAWAALTPAFHTTDEPAHFAYVQAVAELGHPPRALADAGTLSAEHACWYDGLRAAQVRFAANERPPWSARERRALEARCDEQARDHDGAMYHAFQPPGYYVAATAAYAAGGDASLPTRLLLARLVSVLLAAFAVACAYLLVRELIPGSPWPARAGALALAFQPVFMFNEAAVNPDALVVAVASAIALVAARAWRRGLTWQRALALGLLVGVGFWSKANFLLMLPSVAVLALGLALAAREPGGRRRRLILLGAAAAVALACLGLYALVNDLAWDRTLTYRQPAYDVGGGSIGEMLSRTWQFFLPALPFMSDFYGQPPVWTALLQGVTGRLGWWNDFGLPTAQIAALLVGGTALAAAGLVYALPRARRRPWPVAVGALAAGGFFAALLVADYQYSLGAGGSGFEGRYVLPLAAVWALVVGCAVAALPAAWRPAATGLLASAFVLHTLAGIAATAARYHF